MTLNITHQPHTSRFRCLLACTLLIACRCLAASDSWNVNAGGSWTGVANWASGSQYPNGAGEIASFSYNISLPRSVTLTSATTVGGLVFNDADASGQGGTSDKGFTIVQGAHNLILDGGASGYHESDLVLIDVPATNVVGHNISSSGTGKVIFTDQVRVNVENSVEFALQSTKISGSGKLTKTGTGQLLMSGDNVANGYTGDIRVEGGTLQVRSNNNAYGPGVVTLTNNTSARLSHNNFSVTGGPVIPNHLLLEQTASSNFRLNLITAPILTWAGDIANTGPALDFNLTSDFENGGLSYAMTHYTGNNSGLAFAFGKGFAGSNNYIGVGNSNALCSGNSAPVSISSDVASQVGLLATIPTTIASPIRISGNGNVTAAVIGSTITSGVATYTGPLLLNAVPNTNVRQIFLRSEVGGTTSFSPTSVIGNAISQGDKAPVTKIGGGRVEIHGNNTYIGNTAVRTGELVLGNPSALGSAMSPVRLGEPTPVLADVRVATVLSSYAGSLGTFSAGGTYSGAPSAIDSVTLVVGDRVLVKDRGAQNGIYVVSTVSPNVWVRAADMDTSAELAYGQRVRVTSGTLNGGSVYFQAQRGTGVFPGTLVLNSSPLDWHKDIVNPDVSILNNGVDISRNFEVVDNGSSGRSILGGSNTSGVSTYSGSVTLARGLHVTAASGGSVEFSGDIAGVFGVTKVGVGKVVFPNAKSYTGPTVVSTGTLQVDGTLATSGLTIAAGATLQGVGAIANSVAVSGTLAPGNGVGTLTVNAASFSGGGTLAVEIDGATCDRFMCTGTLNLSSSTLTIIPAGAVLSGESYVIAEGAPLTGAFASIPSGYSVSYAGNKATLKAISAYFVSPSGSDTLNDGLTVDSPFATIQRAANLMVPGNTCYIRAGIYRETVTVPRSGTSSLPITFAAYNNESVTISGADPIVSWTLESPNVYRAVNMPAGWVSLNDRNQMFQGSGIQQSLSMLPEARWPNAGSGYPWQDSTIKPSPDWAYVDNAGYDAEGKNGWFMDAALPARPNPANYWAGARAHIMLGDGWYTFTPLVNSYNDLTKTLVTDENHGPVAGASGGAYTMKAGNEYYLTGKKGEMDSPGEWFYDTTSGRMCLYSSGPPANVEVKSRLFGFKFFGRSFINLTNLNFFACTMDPTTPFPTDCTFDGLKMKYLSHHRLREGATGLSLGSRCVLRNSELAFCSNGLIALQGADIKIINNYLHDAAYTPVGVGGIGGNSYGWISYGANRTLISHNTIRTVGHAAITYPGRSSIIQYNDVYDTMKGSTDGGALYWNLDGGNSVVRYNLIHDSAPAAGHSGAGMRGIYLDNQNSGWTVHHNIIWNITGHAMHYNARTNFDKVFNNTCWNCRDGAVQTHAWGDGATGSSFFNNLFNGKAVGNMATWDVTDMRFNYHTDPQFVDPANRNFQLHALSPGIDAGTEIPGVTDGFAGDAPDLGALESGAPDWTGQAGFHPVPPSPDPAYDVSSQIYANQVRDGSFESGNLVPNWIKAAGSNVGLINSSAWYDRHLRTSYYGLQFGGGTSEISQEVNGLIPNRRYRFHCGVQNTDPTSVVLMGVRSYGFPAREISVPMTGIWQQDSADPVGGMFNVPFITGPEATSATIYVKVIRAAGSPVAPKNGTTGNFPTTVATLTSLFNYNNSALVSPWYPSTGVYVDDLAVLLGHENTDVDTAPGPVVSYPFDESEGLTAYDATSSGRDATLTGATFAAGKQGNALTLLATNQSAKAASVNVPSTGGSFTVAFWIKLNSVGATEYPKPVNNAGWQAKGWHITSTPDKGIAMYIWTKNNSLATDSPATGMSCWLSQPLATATWTHVAYTFDRTNGVLRGFRNGVSDSSATIPAGFGDISILTGLHLAAGFSAGQMDDFRLWDTALTAAEVASILSPDPTLALRLKFDERAGAASAWDSSIHQRSGILTNMDVATVWQSGRIDGALAFDGINDHVSVPAFNIPEAVTVACWAKSATPEWNSSGCLISQIQGFALSPEQGGKNIRFTVNGGSSGLISTPVWVPPAGFDITMWHHYAGVFNPATDRLELYVDGYLVSFLPTTASLNVGLAAVSIGRRDAASASFNGLVDDVRIHSRALDWWEILEMSRQIDIGPYAVTGAMTLATDVDGDGLPNDWELAQGLDPMVVNNPFDDSSDHDGLGLLLEYALNQGPLSDSSAALPSFSTVTDPGDGKTYLTIQYHRRTDAPQLLYTVLTSDELLTWNGGAGHTMEISATPTGDGVTELVTTRVLPAISASSPRRLARLRVSIQ